MFTQETAASRHFHQQDSSADLRINSCSLATLQ